MHRALAFVGLGLALAVVLGIVGRRKVGLCYSFFALITASTGFTGFFLLFPESYTPQAFLVKQGIYDVLLFGMSLELAFRIFAAFKGIATRVRQVLGAFVIASSLAILAFTPPGTYAEFWRYQPGVTTAGIWCLTCVALLMVWYQIPIPPFVRAIVLGYVPYLMVFVVCTDLIGRLGWGAIPQLNILNALAYDAMAGYWAHAAWRKD